jgi:hypothetical protein
VEINIILYCSNEDFETLCGEFSSPVVYELLPAAIKSSQEDILLVLQAARKKKRSVANHVERAWLFDALLPFLCGVVTRIPDVETSRPNEYRTVREVLVPHLSQIIDSVLDVTRDVKFQFSPLLPVREHNFRAFFALCYRRGISGERYISSYLKRVACGEVSFEHVHDASQSSDVSDNVVTGGHRLRVLFHQGAIASQLGPLSESEVNLCEQKIIVGLFSEYCERFRGITLSGDLRHPNSLGAHLSSTVPTNLVKEHQAVVKSRRRSQISITCKVLLPSGVKITRKSDRQNVTVKGKFVAPSTRRRGQGRREGGVRSVVGEEQTLSQILPAFEEAVGPIPPDMSGEGFHHLVGIFRAHYQTVLRHDMASKSRSRYKWKEVLKSRDTGANFGPSPGKVARLCAQRRSFNVPVSSSTVVCISVHALSKRQSFQL